MRAAEAAYPGPTLELMERAGKAVAEEILSRFPAARRVAVWCGPGANGGDGLVVAAELLRAGREPAVRLLGPEEKVAGDAAAVLERAQEAGVPFVAEHGAADLAVDALFGTGFSREAPTGGRGGDRGAERRERPGRLDRPALRRRRLDGTGGRRRRRSGAHGDLPRAEGGPRRRARALPRGRGGRRRHRPRRRSDPAPARPRPGSSTSCPGGRSATTSTRPERCSSSAARAA